MKTGEKNKVALLCALGLLIAALLLAHIKYQQSQTLAVSIGAYKSQQAEEKVAIQRLSLELVRHPEVNSIRILAGMTPWRQGVIGFVRNGRGGQKNIFWIDNRFSNSAFNVKSKAGIRAEVLVSEKPIHEAAHHLSTFDNVDYYNNLL